VDASHELVGRRVRSRDGGALGEILAVDEHRRSGRIIGARVRWDEAFTVPITNQSISESNVFWNRLELLPVK